MININLYTFAFAYVFGRCIFHVHVRGKIN